MLIEDTLLHSVQQYKLLPPNEIIVVAVSGGIDSVCLMHLLKMMQASLKITIHIATFDHRTRGTESRLDADFVHQLAQEWSLPCTVGQASAGASISDLARGASTQQKVSENRARQLRYQFLARVAMDVGATTIVTAHHADDQAETVLQRIIRGTSLAGLGAMQMVSPVPFASHLRLVRPLLTVPRQAITAYQQQHAIPYRHDTTNDTHQYQRNKIRHDVMPALATLNPAIQQALIRLAELAQIEDDFIQTHMAQHVLPGLNVYPDHIIIPQATFAQWHRALQQRVCVWCYQHIQTDTAHELTYTHIETTIAHLQNPDVGKVIQWGGGAYVKVTYTDIIIANHHYKSIDTLLRKLTPGITLPFLLEEWLELPTWRLQLTAHRDRDTLALVSLVLPADAKLSLRTRRSGDRFYPPNLKGHQQKLKNWFINHKIPADWRDVVPLLIVDDQIGAILLPETCIIAWQFRLAEDNKLLHVAHQIVALKFDNNP